MGGEDGEGLGELGAGDALSFDLGVGYMDVHLVEINQAALLGSEHFGRYVILPKTIYFKKKSARKG